VRKPFIMTKQVIGYLAKHGNYPFCQTCGKEITVGMMVHPSTIVYRGGTSRTKYFCNECVESEAMYVDGKGER
jgi:hypothetical protein